MSQPVIKFENVGKLYRLGTVGTGTLSHDLRRWWITSVMRREDPYLKIGETNDRSTKGHSDYVYALRDINLEVNEGDVLGIIGKNGAGKSTLLKLLSRVTAPTTGKIYTRGRIASLLEVGTGFHPELTGRENIYMNGCILGMKRHEIDKKLDEIVDFSGCERYIDTPVKRYSSGMMVRLGFAVAAHLDPEILVVDEVLAVGDAEFQKKAIGKMQDVSKGQGRTVLFVSHNMNSILNLCSCGVILDNGSIISKGETKTIVNEYLSQTSHNEKTNIFKKDLRKKDSIYAIGIEVEDFYIEQKEIITNKKVSFILKIKNNSNRHIETYAAIAFFSTNNDSVFQFFSKESGIKFNLHPGTNFIKVQKDSFPVFEGDYYINIWIGDEGNISYDFIPECYYFKVQTGYDINNKTLDYRGFHTLNEAQWSILN